jgi:hypothetical protein
MTQQKPPTGQEALFLVTPHDSFVIPQHEDNVVSIAERAVHLLSALDYLAQARIRDSFAATPGAQEKYGSNASAVLAGAERNAEFYKKAAKYAFGRASGLFTELEHAEEDDRDRIKLDASKSFLDFTNGIRTETGDSISSKTLREQLTRATFIGVAEHNREQTLRPHKSENTQSEKVDKATKGTEEQEDRNDGLTTREKLIALYEDPRAGFLPTTHREKNWVTTYLDYLDNPEFELGPQNQLIEVANFHLKHHKLDAGFDYGIQAGRSIAYEFADLFEAASRELEMLEAVAERLQETFNPNLSLAVAMDAEIEQAIPLIRYIDLVEFRKRGAISHDYRGKNQNLRIDPLRTRRNEDIVEANSDKNKRLEDPYMRADRGKDDAITKWMKKRALQLRVGEVRQTVADAIVDQRRRRNFHLVILQDFSIAKTDMPQLREAQLVASQAITRAA